MKQKTSVTDRIRNCFIYHPWLKFIALVLAILVWLYVKGEISKI